MRRDRLRSISSTRSKRTRRISSRIVRPVAFLKAISARRRDPGNLRATSAAEAPEQAFSRMNASARLTWGGVPMPAGVEARRMRPRAEYVSWTGGVSGWSMRAARISEAR